MIAASVTMRPSSVLPATIPKRCWIARNSAGCRSGSVTLSSRREVSDVYSASRCCDREAQRIVRREQHVHRHRLLEPAQRRGRRLAQRVEAAPRHVPALVVAGDVHVDQHRQQHRRDDAGARRELRPHARAVGAAPRALLRRGRRRRRRGGHERRALLLRSLGHQPHLHASTARTVMKRGSATMVPSKTRRRESTIPREKSFICAQTET